MNALRSILASTTVMLLLGCSLPIQQGDKATEQNLKRLEPVTGRVSLYVCRIYNFNTGSVRSMAVVNDVPIGGLATQTFAHTLLDPGRHTVYLVNEKKVGGALDFAARPTTGLLTFDAKPGDVVILWVGITAGGWGTMTVDHFDSAKEAKDCIDSSTYVVRPS